MEESENKIEFLKALSQKDKWAANPRDLANELSLNISNDDLDVLVNDLYYQGFIRKPHSQHRSNLLPHFDLIIISDNCLALIKEMT